MKKSAQFLKCLIISTSLIIFTSCANFQLDDGEPSAAQAPLTLALEAYPNLHFEDLPIPSNFSYKRSKSFVYESRSGSVKVGHLFFSGWSSLDETIAFYQNEMINKDWSFIRVVEHDGTELLYEKNDKVCRVTLKSTLGQTQIEITIGPK